MIIIQIQPFSIPLCGYINSSIYNNESREYGGGIENAGDMIIVNSTISYNVTSYGGGGISNGGMLKVINTTISSNSADLGGGGVFNRGLDAELTFEKSLISGNSATLGHEVHSMAGAPVVLADNYNLFGHSENAGVVNVVVGATDIVPSVSLDLVLDPILRNNGGPTPTHALPTGSPAVNRIPAADCAAGFVAGVDQRGLPRSPGALCDVGAFELQPPVLDFTIPPRVISRPFPIIPEPICIECLVIRWSEEDWSILFDGSKVGLTKNHAINAFAQIDPSAPDIYLTFDANSIEVPGLGNVPGQDVVHFNGQSFLPYFDGSKVGLTTNGEQIDGLHILSGAASPIGEQCQAYLLISTSGAGKVNGVTGKPIKFSGEDVLGFCATGLGGQTSGKWHLVLDGSKEKVKKNAIINLSANPDGSLLYVTTAGAFDVDNAQGKENEIYRYDMTTGQFDGPLFVPAQFGLSDNLSGINVTGDLP